MHKENSRLAARYLLYLCSISSSSYWLYVRFGLWCMKPDQVFIVIPQVKPTIGTWRLRSLRTGAFTPTHRSGEVKIWRWRWHIFPSVLTDCEARTQSINLLKIIWLQLNSSTTMDFPPWTIISRTDESRQLILYMYFVVNTD